MPTRNNVWELGTDWADPILWYARGVKALKARPLSEPTSWRFYAAIHGIDGELWAETGNYKQGEPVPDQGVMQRFWDQCQHGTWFFLPWHRGYLWAFESIVRAAIVELGGPKDWALPYWNYFKPDQNALPPAFGSPDWPDGKGDNPLFVPERYGPRGDGEVIVLLSQVDLKAMGEPAFTGVASGGSPGFGGVDTGFEHGGQTHGGIESQPHDWVHGLVGGGYVDDSNVEHDGLMSNPNTAGLDPIFWLHHANIDRLWEVWRQNPPTDIDPTDARWLSGPASTGDRPFELPMPGGKIWAYTPAEVTDLAKLEYAYDDYAPAAPALRAPARGGTRTVSADKPTELLGASAAPVALRGAGADAAVQIDEGVRDKVVASFAPTRGGSPDRVFLNLENVRGRADSTAFQVYVGLPKGAVPGPQHHAGNIALFGVSDASDPAEKHGGAGLTFVLDVTDIVDTLHQDGQLAVDTLDVKLVPIKPVPASAQIEIGRISLFRQPG